MGLFGRIAGVGVPGFRLQFCEFGGFPSQSISKAIQQAFNNQQRNLEALIITNIIPEGSLYFYYKGARDVLLITKAPTLFKNQKELPSPRTECCF